MREREREIKIPTFEEEQGIDNLRVREENIQYF